MGRLPVTQRGFLLITAVVLIVTVGLLAAVITFLSAGNVLSGAQHASSAKALFIAESGLEKGAREFSLSSAYTGETNTPFGEGSFTITTSTTDFSGNPLPSKHIRLHSVGQVSGSGAIRTTETIVGPENLLPFSANADFNQDPGLCRQDLGCDPDGWSLNAAVPANRLPEHNYQPWDDCGGPPWPGYPAVSNEPCESSGTWDRAAFVRKGWNGTGSSTSAGNFTFTPAITVTAPITLTLTFDYYFNRLGAGAAGNEMELTFRLKTATETWTSSPSPFLAQLEEQWAQGQVTFAITGSGTKLISQLEFDFELKPGQPKQAWLDNLLLGTSGGPPKTEVKFWREVF